MAENKTHATRASVTAFVAGIAHPERRAEARALIRLMQAATRKRPVMWGPSIVGFDSHHYTYASGREGDMPVIAFSPRKGALVLYVRIPESATKKDLARLGRHTTGRGCLYIKRLADVDQGVLAQMLVKAVRTTRTVALQTAQR